MWTEKKIVRLPKLPHISWENLSRGKALGLRRNKKSLSWYLRTRVDGKYVTELLGLDLSLDQATKLATKRGGSSTTTVKDLAAIYLRSYSLRVNDDALTRSSTYIINRYIVSLIGTIKLSELSRTHIEEWLDFIRKAFRQPSSANRVMAVLRAILNDGHARGLVLDSFIWGQLRPFKHDSPSRLRWLTPEEARKLLDACNPDFRNLVYAALLTGMRYGELIRLTPADLDLESNTIYVSKSKGGKPRYIPIPEEGRSFFRKLVESGFLFRNEHGTNYKSGYQIKLMARAVKKAGIESVTFHGLRHTYASWLAQRGVSLHTIANLLGHSTTKMVENHYAHLSPSVKKEAVEALPKLYEQG